MAHKFTLLRTFFYGKDGKLAIMQRPNAPLVIWLFFTVLGHVLSPGNIRTVTQGVSRIAILIWASLEVYSGASYFRRALGLLILILSVISLW